MADNTLKTSRVIALIQYDSTTEPHAARCFDSYGAALDWAAGHWQAAGFEYNAGVFRDPEGTKMGLPVEVYKDGDGLIQAVVARDGQDLVITLMEESD